MGTDLKGFLSDGQRDLLGVVGFAISILQLVFVFWQPSTLRAAFALRRDADIQQKTPIGLWWSIVFAAGVLVWWSYEPVTAWLRVEFRRIENDPTLMVPVVAVAAMVLVLWFLGPKLEDLASTLGDQVRSRFDQMRRPPHVASKPAVRPGAQPKDQFASATWYEEKRLEERRVREKVEGDAFFAKHGRGQGAYCADYYDRGHAYLDEGQWWRAHEAFRKVFKVDPDYRNIRSYLNQTTTFVRLRVLAAGLLLLSIYAVVALLW